MLKINVNEKIKNPRCYWPKELIMAGWHGALQIKANACVLVMPKPDAKAKDIARSLEILALQYKHDAEIAGEE